MPQFRPESHAGSLPPDAVEVRRLLEKGNSKSAVELARQIHKRLGSPASELLLVEAYAERVRSLLAHRFVMEAEALMGMVRQRYPKFAARLDAVQGDLRTAGGGLDELVRPLADPAASAEDRAAAERAIRTELADPSALARCAAAPPDHPLRLGADAIRRALEAVTSGPVDDAALALPEVPRRSPLSPWKPLVRAIGCFYRREDAACEEWLRAIDPESAAARLVPTLRAMLDGKAPRKLKGAAASLAARVCGSLEELRAALGRIDGDPNYKRTRSFLEDVGLAMATAQRECPEITTPLRRQLAVRSLLADVSPKAAAAALGGGPRCDARYYLAVARAMEADEGTSALTACHYWEDFREQAGREHWFPERGSEAATVYLHMAELAAAIDPEELADEREAVAGFLRETAPEGFDLPEPDFPFLHPEWLYEQACAMDPIPESFQQWVAWAEKQAGPAAAQEAAETWRRALPGDPRPLLRLMRYAEDRNALKKALGYLREAEALDGVSTEVRRARLRLLMLGAIRHLKQGKWRLAEPELAELEALPQAREGDRPAFLAALRFLSSSLAGDAQRGEEIGRRMEELLGGSLAAYLAASFIAAACELPVPARVAPPEGRWMEALPRVSAMAADMGFALRVPDMYKPAILKELKSAGSADPAALDKLGAVAVDHLWRDVAWAVSSIGLKQRGPFGARFLLLRAWALPESQYMRREDCLAAAFALARRDNDPALADKARQLWRQTSFAGSIGVEPHEFSNRRLEKLLDEERRSAPPPGFDSDGFENGYVPSRRRPRRGARRRPPADTDSELPF